MNRRGIEIAAQGQKVEFQACPFGRDKQLTVATSPQAGTASHNAGLTMHRLHGLEEQRRFLVERDGKRIHTPRGDDPVSMDRLIGEFHPFTCKGCGAFGNVDRQVSHARGFFQ